MTKEEVAARDEGFVKYPILRVTEVLAGTEVVAELGTISLNVMIFPAYDASQKTSKYAKGRTVFRARVVMVICEGTVMTISPRGGKGF